MAGDMGAVCCGLCRETWHLSQDMNELELRIHREIAEKGDIPFSRFMGLALYETDLGYYETQREVGREGDFYTNVSVGSLYGELLGFQFADWLSEIEGPVQLVEAGAHDGRLAGDILSYLRDWRQDLYKRTELVLLEPSPTRLRWQQAMLDAFEDKVKWGHDEGEPFRGVFYANELLDAVPVDRLVWDADREQWAQSYVKLEAGKFKCSIRSGAQINWLDSHAVFPDSSFKNWGLLPDGYVMVLPLGGHYKLWDEICGSLAEGKAVTIDYGMEEEDFFEPPRDNGTLRGYHRHRQVDDILERPGEVDITASVNFTSVRRSAQNWGLECKPLSAQANFLVSVFEKTLSRPEQFPEWTPERRRQFQTLVHPEHLGRSFKVFECGRS